jgi:hypothetical protein
MSTVQEVERQLAEACSRHGATKLSNVVHDLGLPINLVALLLAEAGVDGDRKAAETGKMTLLGGLHAGGLLRWRFRGGKGTPAKATREVVSLGGRSSEQGSRLCTQVSSEGEFIDIDGLRRIQPPGGLVDRSVRRHFGRRRRSLYDNQAIGYLRMTRPISPRR